MKPREPRTHHDRRTHRLVPVIALILLLAALPLLAACGDDAATATPAAATTATPGTGAQATATPAAEPTPTQADPAPTETQPAPTATQQPAPATATPAPAATPTTAGPAPTATPATPDLLTLSVYFIRDEKIGTAHRQIPRTQQVAAAAMNELLDGPTAQEQEAGLETTIPEGTTLNGVTIANGVATVDLSGDYEEGGGSFSMSARLAQVVYTLTQFPTVDRVLFELDGEPVEVFSGEGLVLDGPLGRADFEELTPLIFVESPAPFDVIDSSQPLRIHGTANTFEAVFQINIVDAAGLIVYDNFAMATSGTGTRGTFDEEITFEITRPGQGALIVFEHSARDGSPVNIVEIPLVFE
jgi:germination protein M